MNSYEVTGPRPYRGTKPGEVYLADGEDPAIRRAVDSKVLTLIGPAKPSGVQHLKITSPVETVQSSFSSSGGFSSVVDPEDGGSQ